MKVKIKHLVTASKLLTDTKEIPGWRVEFAKVIALAKELQKQENESKQSIQ